VDVTAGDQPPAAGWQAVYAGMLDSLSQTK
jgi:hypothetical protein